MFDPDGYQPVPLIVAWISGLGVEGKLPRRLGFVHPGDTPSGLDLPPEVTARFVIGEKLAAGKLVAQAVMHVDGSRKLIPAHYWSGPAARDTMMRGFVDMSFFGYERDLHIVHAILAVDDVAAALGFRMVPPSVDQPAPDSTGDNPHLEPTSAGVSAPAPPLTNDQSSPSAEPSPPPPARVRGRGGRPPLYDWAAFARELVRFGNLDGFDTIKQARAHMKNWMTEQWSTLPDDRAWQRKLEELIPEGTPFE